MLKDKVLKYINAFSSKDVNTISCMISDDILIEDWNETISSRHNAILFFKKIFESANEIKVEISDVWNDANVVIARIQIQIDRASLDVVDVIKFDENIKISQIIAFKQ